MGVFECEHGCGTYVGEFGDAKHECAGTIVIERDALRTQVEELKSEISLRAQKLAINERTRLRETNERLAKRSADLEEIALRLRNILLPRACSDGGCRWRHPRGGMHTNGGCQNDKMDKHELRREMRCLGDELRCLLRDVEDLLSQESGVQSR